MPDPHFDTAALERAIAEKANRLKASCRTEEERLADDIADRSRALVAPHRQSGETEDAIHVTRGKDGATVHFKNPYLEFGTSRSRASPFARPAIAEAPAKLHKPDFH